MEQPPTLYPREDGSHPSEADSQPAERGKETTTSPHGELQMATMTAYPKTTARPALSKTPAQQIDMSRVAAAAKAETTSVFSKALEAFFTLSIMFSIALIPFILIQALAPQVMTFIISSGVSVLFVPYAIVMALVGLKISSLFGCSAWNRIVAEHTEKDEDNSPE